MKIGISPQTEKILLYGFRYIKAVKKHNCFTTCIFVISVRICSGCKQNETIQFFFNFYINGERPDFTQYKLKHKRTFFKKTNNNLFAIHTWQHNFLNQ